MAKPLEHPLVIILITGLFLVLFTSLRRTSDKTAQSTEEISSLEKEAYTLSKEVQTLQEELEYSKSQEYKEKIIRDQLLLKKENEYIVQLAVPEETVKDPDINPETTSTNQEKWLEILF